MKKYFSSYWIRSAFFTILQRFSLTFFGFVNFFLLIRGLSKDDMGIWTLFLAVTTIYEMTKTNLLKNAHIKYVSGSQEVGEKTVIASSSLVINLSITLLFVGLIFAISPFSGHWKHTGSQLLVLLRWYIPGLVLMSLFTHLEAIQQSHLDFKGVFAGYFIRQLLFFVFIAIHWLGHIPFSLTGLVVYQTISILAGSAVLYYFSRPYLHYRFDPTRAWIRKITGYGGYIFGSGIVAQLFSNLDQLMTARFLKPANVASYSSAFRVNQLIDIPSYAASEVLFPKVSSAAALEGPNRVKYLYERMVAILMAFTTPAALFIMLFPGFVITTIAGKQYSDAAPILQLYMLTAIMRPAQNQAANLLNSIGRAKLVFYINAACLVVNCFINYLCLVHFGLYGPAYGTVITCLLGSILWYMIMRKEIGMELGTIARHTFDVYRNLFGFIMKFFSKKASVPAEDLSSSTPTSPRGLRIAYLANNNPHDKTSWSGITYYLGQALGRNVGEVEFFWPIRFPWLVTKYMMAMVKLQRVLFGRQYKIQYSLVYSWFACRFIQKQMKGKHYDCIVSPTGSMLLAYLKTDVPIVYFTDVTFRLYSRFYKKEFKNISPLTLWEGDILEKKALQKADHVIYTSHWASNSAMQHYGVPAAKISHHHLGANMDHYPGAEVIFEKEKNEELSLLFLGVDWDRKGGQIAVDALEALHAQGIPARLVIAGCVPPNGYTHPSLEVIPFLDKNRKEHHDRFIQLLTYSHFLLLPTRADCSSTVTSESNAYGMPSIMTDTGGVADIVTDGVNGYCLPYEAMGPDYARKIVEIYSDKARYHELIRTSRKKFEEELNWDKWTEHFLTIYRKQLRKEQEPEVRLQPELC